MQANVLFWKLVDNIHLDDADTVGRAVEIVGETFETYTVDDVPDDELRGYLEHYGRSLRIWNGLFDEDPSDNGRDGDEVDDDACGDGEQPAEVGD